MDPPLLLCVAVLHGVVKQEVRAGILCTLGKIKGQWVISSTALAQPAIVAASSVEYLAMLRHVLQRIFDFQSPLRLHRVSASYHFRHGAPYSSRPRTKQNLMHLATGIPTHCSHTSYRMSPTSSYSFALRCLPRTASTFLLPSCSDSLPLHCIHQQHALANWLQPLASPTIPGIAHQKNIWAQAKEAATKCIQHGIHMGTR